MIDPKSDVTTGYHLFFVPEGESFDRLQSVIEKLSGNMGSPRFVPHATVLARIAPEPVEELCAKTDFLAGTIAPFIATTGAIGMEDTYYRALYFHLEPEQAFLSAHMQAQKLFSGASGTYVPHLSLLYGLYSQSKKEVLLKDITISSLDFKVNTMHLYKTEGAVHRWKKIHSAHLGGA